MTPEEMKKSVDEINSLTVELRKKAEAAEKKGAENDVTFKANEEKLNARISELETKLNRPVLETSKSEALDQKKAAFGSFLRKGVASMSPEEQKFLSVGDNVNGGYLAPEDYVLEIIKQLAEVSPVRQLARISSTMMSRVVIPKRTGLVAATWSPETVASTASNSTYGAEEIAINTLTAESIVTLELLRDAAFNVESEIRMDVLEQFASAEGTGFVTGDKIGKPEGFLSNASVGSVTSGAVATLTFDDIINLMYSVQTQYSRNGTFVMSRGIIKAVRKLKDSQGRYLWEPSQQAGQPSTIQGKPVVEMPDMAQTVVTGAKAITFGDFAQGYRIVDRADMTVVRDDYTMASNRKVKFVFHRAVGGQVVLPVALSTLVIQ